MNKFSDHEDLASIVKRLDIAYLRVGPDGLVHRVSQAFVRMSGRVSHELEGRPLFDVLRFEEGDQRVIRELLIEPRAARELPCRLDTPDGVCRSITLRVTSNLKGGFEAVAHDVTFWANERDRLCDEARRYRNVSELASDCAYVFRVLPGGDIEHQWVFGSLVDITGYSVDEIHERGGWQVLLHPDDLPIAEAQLRDLLDGQRSVVEYRIITKDGRIRRIRDVARAVFDSGRVTRIEGALRDVTERRQMERDLAESHDRYLALFESVNAAIFIADAETGILLDANTDAEKLVGRSRDQLIGMHQSELHPKGESERYREMFRQHVDSDRVVSVEAEVIRLDGTRVPVSIYGSQTEFDGRVCQLGVFHDLTEGKRAEAVMRKENELRRAIIKHAAEGIAVCHEVNDARTVEFTIWNDRMVELTGYTREEINRIGWFEALWPDLILRDQARERFHRIFSGEELLGDVRDVVRKDGQHRRLLFSKSLLEGDGGAAHVLALISDMTDRERMLEHLRQSEKMEAIGQLAGGIAHDINNQLAGIMGLAELMAHELSRLPASPPITKTAGRANQVVDICIRARGVTQQLLAFARRGRYRTERVDVHEVVEQVVSMLSHSIDKRIQLIVHSKPGVAIVQGDSSQIQSALLNIAINARDAMPNGGQLTFEVTLDEGFEGSKPSFVQIKITDTGTGMSEVTRQKIFEPFFTTKPPGKGTGMGLAAAYGTVENHGGRLQVDSRLGHGTTFCVLLPYQPEPYRDGVTPRSSEHRPRRKARILLADDEETVRETLAAMLHQAGHEVITCADGESALEEYGKRWRELDLVVLDMVMPRRGGHEVFRDMLQLNPDVRVLLISGHTVDLEAREVLQLGAAGFLQKPFSFDSLTNVVDQVLSSAGRVKQDRPPRP
jgi:PAS domain S-box-containing protein